MGLDGVHALLQSRVVAADKGKKRIEAGIVTEVCITNMLTTQIAGSYCVKIIKLS